MPDAEKAKLDAEILAFIRDSSEREPSERIFETLAFKLFDFQFRRNENYRRFCLAERKSPGKLRDWKEIPAMPAAGFKELVLATFPIREAVKTFKTSGTTGPSRGVHLLDTLELYEASLLPPFKRYLMPDDGDFSFFFLVTAPDEAPYSSLSHMMGVVKRRLARGKGKFYVKGRRLLCRELERDLKRSRKRALVLATAFSLLGFLEHLRTERKTLRLLPGSRLMETGGFKGRTRAVSPSALYAECEKRLGIPRHHCVGEYGMTELSSQFYDTRLRDAHLGAKRRPVMAGPAWLKAVGVDPVTGREAGKGRLGLLRIFDLANRGSVLAIQTEDVARMRDGGFELLGRARGSELKGCSLGYEAFLRGGGGRA